MCHLKVGCKRHAFICHPRIGACYLSHAILGQIHVTSHMSLQDTYMSFLTCHLRINYVCYFRIDYMSSLDKLDHYFCGGSKEQRGLDHREACISQLEEVSKVRGVRLPEDGRINKVVSILRKPRKRRRAMEGARDVAGSFLKDISLTSTLNASCQLYQLH